MGTKLQPSGVRELLSNILGGDLRKLVELSTLSQKEVDSAGIFDFELSVNCDVVLGVMKNYVEGNLEQSEAQAWGELVRWHRFRGVNRSVVELEFELARGADEAESDVCIEIVSNLDELGDLIDGEITPEIYQECLDDYQAFLIKRSGS